MLAALGVLAAAVPVANGVANAPLASASGSATGAVFRDDNFDGARALTEVGVAGVTVTAVDGAATVVSTAITEASGNYNLALSGVGPYRVEFSGLPDGLTAGPAGTDSGTTVQFVPDGGGTGIDLGVTSPGDYCQADPMLVTSCFLYGDQLTGINTTSSALRAFPYSSTSSSPAPASLATAAQIGTTFGIAYQRSTGDLFEGAYMRRHAGLGPLGIGGVYKGANPYVDLNSVPGFNGVGVDPRPAVPEYDIDAAAFAAVGSVGLGDIDMGPDDSTMYAVNLGNNQLVTIPVRAAAPTSAAATGVTPASGQIGQFQIPAPADCVSPHAMALDVHDGLVYIGGVCSAEATQNAADLSLYIFTFDPATRSFSGPVFESPLDYVRRCAEAAGNPAGAATAAIAPGCSTAQRATWRPWISASPLFPLNANPKIAFPQPMFSGLDFDHGNLIIGLRDRFGDQAVAEMNPGARTTYGTTDEAMRTAGELLRACGNPVDGWSMESNGNCGTPQAAWTSTGAGNQQGPGGGEYYNSEFVQPYHDEAASGSVLQLAADTKVISTEMDPTQLNSGGTRKFVNAGPDAGSSEALDSYEVYPPGGATFGKANGLGDLEALCDEAPIEIGNRVWRDSDRDGVQDATEAPIAGVTLNLFLDDVLVGAAITDANGQYLFNAANVAGGILANRDYEIRVDHLADYLPGGPLAGLKATDSTSGPDRSVDSNAAPVNGIPTISVTTGAPGDNDHTLDAGFTASLSLGNLVWDDPNNNGIHDAGESGVAGVTVKLFDGAGNEVNVGPDGILGTADDAPGGMVTDADGRYQFAHLEEGTYHVEISNLPTGYISSHDPATGATPDNDVDDDDNGSGTGAGVIVSVPVALTRNAEPIDDGDSDTNSNLSVDFGLFHTEPALGVKKFTNGYDAQSATGAVGPLDENDTDHNPLIEADGTVTWTYVVTNLGNVTLVDVTAVDSDPDVDIDCPATTLAVGGSMTCTASGRAVLGQYANTVLVTANASPNPGGSTTPVPPATDPSHYYGTEIEVIVTPTTTTTTTSAPSTTTSAPATTMPGPTTTTVVGAVKGAVDRGTASQTLTVVNAPSESAATSKGWLASTGGDVALLVMVGLGLIAGGVMVRRSTRSRSLGD